MTLEKFIKGHKYVYLKTTTPAFHPKGSWVDPAKTVGIFTCLYVFDGEKGAFFLYGNEKRIKAWTIGTINWVDVTDMSEEEIEKILAEKRKLLVADRI